MVSNPGPLAFGLLALALSACVERAGVQATPAATPVASAADTVVTREAYEQNAQRASDSLQALAELELVYVGDMIVDAPAASHNCYGPCDDDPVDLAWMAEHARQTERLSRLTELAGEVAGAHATPVADLTEALEALDALQIVGIQGVQYAPSSGNCYVSACPGDDEQRGRVAALAEAATDL